MLEPFPPDVLATLRSFLRGELPVAQFEEWAYGRASLADELGEQFYVEVISTDFGDDEEVAALRRKLARFARQVTPVRKPPRLDGSVTIVRDDVIPLLLESCPSYRAHWSERVSADDYDEDLLTLDLGDFARHLVSLIRGGDTSEFAAVFEVIEQLHLHANAHVQNAVVVGLLEGIQNNALDPQSGVSVQSFLPHLKSKTLKSWEALNAFWEGRST